jgi:multisubunit Na+/H+ antiporter MnhC subunit
MTPNLLYVAVVGVLFAAGVSLLLERSLTRILMGVLLLGNGVNLLIIMSSRAGRAPIVGSGRELPMSDPLPQAMILTAIVITLGMTGFVLALAYRTWRLVGHDEVQDDVEDRRIMELAVLDEGPGGDEGPEGRDDGGPEGRDDEDAGGVAPDAAGSPGATR